jgi:hypothetical protein
MFKMVIMMMTMMTFVFCICAVPITGHLTVDAAHKNEEMS